MTAPTQNFHLVSTAEFEATDNAALRPFLDALDKWEQLVKTSEGFVFLRASVSDVAHGRFTATLVEEWMDSSLRDAAFERFRSQVGLEAWTVLHRFDTSSFGTRFRSGRTRTTVADTDLQIDLGRLGLFAEALDLASTPDPGGSTDGVNVEALRSAAAPVVSLGTQLARHDVIITAMAKLVERGLGHHVDACSHLGDAYSALEQWTDAEQWYRRGIAEGEFVPETGMFRVLQELKKWSEARDFMLGRLFSHPPEKRKVQADRLIATRTGIRREQVRDLVLQQPPSDDTVEWMSRAELLGWGSVGDKRLEMHAYVHALRLSRQHGDDKWRPIMFTYLQTGTMRDDSAFGAQVKAICSDYNYNRKDDDELLTDIDEFLASYPVDDVPRLFTELASTHALSGGADGPSAG